MARYRHSSHSLVKQNDGFHLLRAPAGGLSRFRNNSCKSSHRSHEKIGKVRISKKTIRKNYNDWASSQQNINVLQGTVYWITGLSGVGKTTLGRLLYQHLAETKPNVVFLDGDELREVFGGDLGHSREDRQKSAMRNARLCKMLSDQGIDVVCSTISLFHDCQRWNRENIAAYKEIFIHAPTEVLVARDPKGLYRAALSGEGGSMVGLDIKHEQPLNPDVTIVNDGNKTPSEIASTLIAELVR